MDSCPKSHISFWSHDFVRTLDALNNYISTTTVPTATKLGRLGTYHEGPLPMLLQPLVTWSYEIALQTKTIISPLPQYLWLQNVTDWLLTMRGFYPCYSTLWSLALTRLRYRLKPLYPHYHNVYGHKTCKHGYLPWMFLPIKSNNHIIMWFCKILWQTTNIFTTAMPMATKLGRLVTYLGCLLPIKSNDHVIMWFCKITWQTKNISTTVIPVATKLGRMMTSTWQDDDLPWVTSIHKVSWPYNHVVL